MKLLLNRTDSDDACMMGEMSVNDSPIGFTLERPWLDNAQQVSCIPMGTYKIILTMSGHFKRMMPLLLDVPNRSEVRIHPANWPSQLLGCIAVGKDKGVDSIGHSDIVFEPLLKQITEALAANEEVTIEITDTTGAE